MTNKLELTDFADWIWGFGSVFFMETAKGNFVWSDPSYGGDNTIRPFKGSYVQWCEKEGIGFGRDKGKGFIKDRCGPDVKIV